MDFTLTLDKILEFPNEIIETTKKYDEMSEIISNDICDMYDTKELANNVNKLFDKFKHIKYSCNFSVESAIKITTSYGLREGSSQRSRISQGENIVTREVDNLLWATKFYDTVIFTCQKLTNQEAIFLTDILIKNRSISDVAEKLEVCTRTVHHIKKSCLIKLWGELKSLDETDNI